MQILVVNGGSSSIKFKIYDKENKSEVMSGLLEKIGSPKAILNISKNDKKESFEIEVKDVSDGFLKIFDLFLKEENKIKYEITDILAIGHRVVHGVNYKSSVLITDEVYKKLKDNLHLAPLHNPAALSGIKRAKECFENVPNVAVFDTSFHQSMPDYSYMYPISMDYYHEYQLRRYGAHGTSHQYISMSLAKHLGKNYHDFNCVTAHLGNGCSISAIKNGQSIDTSMGLTPLEGLMMGTRSGSIDPSIVGFICNRKNKTVDEVITELNKKSGLLAIAGVNDMRDISKKIAQNDDNARLAMDMFVHRVKKQIGAYIALLDGDVDALIFSGGIGENDLGVRYMTTKGLDYAGFKIDKVKNEMSNKGIKEIGEKIYVVPTNEELQICNDTLEITRV